MSSRLLFATLLAFAAGVQAGPVTVSDTALTRFDLDGDGALSAEELTRSGLFAPLDADGDGTLPTEALLSRPARALDGNEDGRVTREEFYTGVFTQADDDLDDRLTQTEFNKALSDTRELQLATVALVPRA